MKEQPHHQKAFEIYYGLGPGRTLAEAAKRAGLSLGTAKLCSREFGWAARVGEREAATAASVQREVVNDDAERRTRNQRILEASILDYARGVRGGSIKYTPQALEALFRMEEQILGQGELQDGIDRDLRSKNPEELQAMLLAELREVVELLGPEVVRGVLDEAQTDLVPAGPN